MEIREKGKEAENKEQNVNSHRIHLESMRISSCYSFNLTVFLKKSILRFGYTFFFFASSELSDAVLLTCGAETWKVLYIHSTIKEIVIDKPLSDR